MRQVVKTYARGFGLEVVEVPHDGGTTDPDRVREAARDAAAVIFQQPNFFGCLEPAPDLAAAANDAGALPIAHVDLVSLGVLEAPGNYGCALAIGEGQSAGNSMSYGGPHYGFLAARDELHPPAAGPDRRRDGRRRGRARLRAHAADARAAHPAREGDLEHHHQPDPARAGRARAPVAARPAGAARDGGDLHGARRATRRSGSPSAGSSSRSPSGTTFKEFAVRVGRRDAEAIRAARGRTGVNPGYPLGRDYAGLDDALLVAVTETRTVEDIDRLVEALGA